MDAARKTDQPAAAITVADPANVRRESSVAPDRVSYAVVTDDEAGQRLDNFLLRIAKGVPKSHVYRIVRGGEVRVNKGRVAVDYRLQPGDEIRIPPMRLAERSLNKAAAPAEIPPVLYEDEHLIAVDKPSGLAAHGGSGVAFGLIERVRAARPQQPFLELAHRLDRETSGILLLAKTRRALVKLHEDLREGRFDKRYFALVAGDWVNDRQHVKLALTKFFTHAGERRVVVDPEGMASHTVFNLNTRTSSPWGPLSLLEAELKTGRTHQIRVHLAHLGFPILQDDKYGDFDLNKSLGKGRDGLRLTRMFLHAHSVRLRHPVTEQALHIVAPLPAVCADFLEALEHVSKI